MIGPWNKTHTSYDRPVIRNGSNMLEMGAAQEMGPLNSKKGNSISRHSRKLYLVNSWLHHSMKTSSL